MNYLTYPLKTMNITQSYTDKYSHKPSYQGKPQSFPIDDGGKDGGRDYMYCPCDEMIVKRIYGLGNDKLSNTIWLQSTTKVQTPTFNDYVTLMVVHPNDDDVSKLKVGQVFKRGQAIVREGTSGLATGNHFHIEIAQGEFKSLANNGWVKNSLGAWVLSGNTKKPEECFFITDTTIKNSRGLTFINLIGNPVLRNVSNKQVEILAHNLRVRETPNGKIHGYIKMGIYDIKSIKDTWIELDCGYVGMGDWLKVLSIVVETKDLQKELSDCETKLKEALSDIDKLNIIIKQLENNKFDKVVENDGYYRIKLYKGEHIIIK